MAKARYTATTNGSVTIIHRIGPPGDFPVGWIVPLGSQGGGLAAAPRTARSRRSPKKKNRRARD